MKTARESPHSGRTNGASGTLETLSHGWLYSDVTQWGQQHGQKTRRRHHQGDIVLIIPTLCRLPKSIQSKLFQN